MKDPLKQTVICLSGEFGKDRSRKQIKQWIEVNGGQVSNTFSADVTHLVCSEADYKGKPDALQNAKARKIPVVSYDWLEDSILKKRNLAPRIYEWATIMKKKEKIDAKRNRKEGSKLIQDAKRFTDGCHAAKQDIFSGESEPATKSMNRLVLDSFMTDMDKKQTRKKDAKVTKEAPNSTNSKAPAKPRTSRKRNADSQCDPDELAGPEKAEEEELMVLATTKRQRGGRSTRPVAFGKNGKAFYAIHVPTVDPGKIIRAPTNEEIQNNLLIQADEDFSFPENYHVYRDASSGLDFAIILVRLDIHNNTGGERIFLRLYESNTEPHTYAAHLRYASPQCANKDSNLAPLGSSFELAFEGYRNAFKDHTHVDWMYRIRACAKVGTGPKEAKKFVKADGTEVKEVPYFYVKVQPVE